MIPANAAIIAQTLCWVRKVVVDLKFCPFAKTVLQDDSLACVVTDASEPGGGLQAVADLCRRMDREPGMETVLLVLPAAFSDFEDFLDLLGLAEDLLAQSGYTGIYQLASFHPDYQFADSSPGDAANYTNRSPWPMLQVLREASLEQALASHPAPDQIPQRNIETARGLGEKAMQVRLQRCTHPLPTD